MKTISIMQPYLFPYLGYYQLLQVADKFIFLDDVNFIVRGWINRNRIYSPQGPQSFTVPLTQASQNRRIREISVHEDEGWRPKLFRTLDHTYRKAPYFNQVFPLVTEVLNLKQRTIAEVAEASVIQVMRYLGREPQIARSSEYELPEARGEARILGLCLAEAADRYVNAIGGVDLYSPDTFRQHDIELKFIKMHPVTYPQFSGSSTEPLSIIDVLMFNSVEAVGQMLEAYELT
jgi:WbqC-like protein family